MVGRLIEKAVQGDPDLGVLGLLPGSWANTGALAGHGWNLIALPFGRAGQLGDFRLLLNQFNETLTFSTVDKHVPNRGDNHIDQHVAAVQYIQHIIQLAATDAAITATGGLTIPATPDSDDTPKTGTLPPPSPAGTPAAIHHEPGLLLRLESQTAGGPTLGRLATIPHGDSVLALGHSIDAQAGAPNFNDPKFANLFTSLPIGVGPASVGGKPNPYLAPYEHFTGANKFRGILDATDPKSLLAGAIPPATVKNTTTIILTTEIPDGGIHNIPFVTRKADATSMSIAMWIQELDDGSKVLQYVQKVILKFFPRADHVAGLIEWPHISFNSLVLQP